MSFNNAARKFTNMWLSIAIDFDLYFNANGYIIKPNKRQLFILGSINNNVRKIVSKNGSTNTRQ